MKCPKSQKETLLAIYSICQNREDNVDVFREMGGVAFVYSLSKSSIVHPDVKETAIFTLGTLAEANAHCKTFLCRKDTFSHLASLLMLLDSPVTLRRVSVYLLSVLVANNKLGQSFAQNTGCLDILLELFRSSFPFPTSDVSVTLHVSQMHQLWTSVANALCGCVNNPQNVDAQRICVAAYPLVKSWLQGITLPRTEMFKPLCLFIAMSVGNNSDSQESFSASGCLESLTRTLVRFAADAEKSRLCCQISVIITKTLSSCITDNAVLVRALAQYGLVPQLVSLLSSTHLDPRDRLPVLLTLGHCTEASEEHQGQLVQCGGLSAIITLLTEFPTEELRKAATFILQTCKQATMSLGGPGPANAQGEDWEEAGASTDMDAYWKSAKDLLHRIHHLEKRQQGAACPTYTTRRQGDGEMSRESFGPEENHGELTSLACAKQTGPRGGERVGQGRHQQSCWRDLSLGLPQRNHAEDVHQKEEDQQRRVRAGHAVTYPVQVNRVRSTIFESNEEADLHRAVAEFDRALEDENRHVSHVDAQSSVCQVNDALSLCSELLDDEIRQYCGRYPENVAKRVAQPLGERCSGCVLPFDAVTSRTFWALQSSCRHSCDMHRVLEEACDAFRARRMLFRRKPQGGAAVCARGPRDAPEEAQRRRRREAGEQRQRNDFSRKEVKYLLNGVKKFGSSWNSILWSYPFQPGRTNVSLAKKYRQLMVTAT
ncbi:hypothetical protein NHX12_002632 [Muraenolepis orangiensis]|uniref:Myb-like domain-containing protein n=1 Tax=Muraenolepis orangiensis TaxID=630683 RepID=A0A9Q0DZ68_9TELE|nr:hypothetical protein NHX12_002632 [Muraenolepis orangiensis]